MATWLIKLVTLAYIWTAIDLCRSGKPGMGLAFAGYAIANVGLIWAIE